MEITGKVHLIGNVESIGNNGFTKRLIVVETQEQYKQTIPIDFVKDKTSLLDSFSIGQEVKVSINIRGNEHQGKYYVNLQGWRIEGVGSKPKQAQEPQHIPDNNNDEENDTPF